ncbi:hypothetical protein ABI59_07220 [Acidobacteria bacterium Mor1]|nr:hypothetical protein ABI59_07220 [Acidobacteria bacterium Mor1]
MSRADSQRGATLVQVALFMFALMAVAALTVDLALMSWSRGQMQVAADGASLLALQGRDESGVIPGCAPSTADCERRLDAQSLVSTIFDDDGDLTADALRLGAGPTLELQQVAGAGSPWIRQLGQSGNGVYDPLLELNLVNEIGGDMVAGSFVDGGASVEDIDFTRGDFLPAATPDAPTAFSMLVRLRRVGDVENVAGTRSSGPRLPFLFGQGSVMSFEEVDGASARRDGIGLRAVAIADARRAGSIGARDGGLALLGRTDFGLTRTFWDGLTTGAPTVLDIQPVGVVTVTGSILPVGTFLDGSFDIGAVVQRSGPAPTAAGEGYVPIYELVSGVERVVGFGYLEDVAIIAGQLTFTKQASRMARRNAAPRPGDSLVGLDAADLAQVLASFDALDEPLLAAALVR